MPSLPKAANPFLLAGSITLATVLACGSQPSAAPDPGPVALTTTQDSTIYALGLGISGQLRGLFTEQELVVLNRGIRDGVLGDERLELGAFISKLDPFLSQRRADRAEGLQQETAAYMAEAAAQPGAVQTESGLVYIEESAGSGPKPVVGSTVSVHYTGMFTDGSVFDSSRSREPITFPLGQGKVIPGWEEGLQLMQQGAKGRFVIPPSLGYGEQGHQVIPGNVALVFDIELVQVQ